MSDLINASLSETNKQLQSKFVSKNDNETFKLLTDAGGHASASAGTDAFKKSWESIMSTKSGAESQHHYAISQYFVPAADKVTRSTGIDVRVKSKTLQDVLWSTAIQHGAGGCNKVFKNAVKA